MGNKQRILTENQEKFLACLFGEARGNAEKAKALAGYAESVRVSEIVKSLRSEIVEIAMDHMAMNAPRAAMSLEDLLLDPNQAGALTKIKVAQEILNRSGAMTKSEDITLKVPQGGLFIMPAKEIKEIVDVQNQETDKTEEL
jgi:hypothetical protein